MRRRRATIAPAQITAAGDGVLIVAMLDRANHHFTIVKIDSESYRLNDERKAGLLTPIEATRH
jgi:hypothetical protein